MGQYTDILDTFSLDTLPDLDTVTLAALERFSETPLPSVDFGQFDRPLVVGSGNAAVTGKLLFDTVDAVFADESSYIQKLDAYSSIDGAFVISASGSKHAVGIITELLKRNIPVVLLTNTENSPAGALLSTEAVHVFPKNREPYTYNTSTYMGMLLSKTHEDAAVILDHLHEIEDLIPKNFSVYDAYFLIVPERFNAVREMFQTKFDELFGPRIKGRVFTLEQTKHAKTVIELPSELFISFGEDNTYFGAEDARVFIPLPPGASYATMMAVGYFVLGHLQRQLPPYYKERIAVYSEETSALFGTTIKPIVE